MKTPTTLDDRLTARLAELATQRAAIPDEAPPPRVATTADVDAQVTALQRAAALVAELGSDEADQAWIDFGTHAEVTMRGELEAIHLPIRDAAVRDVARNLGTSLDLLDRGLGVFAFPVVDLGPLRIGQLMAEAGYATSGRDLHGPRGWRGSLPEVKERLKTLSARRAAAEAALAGMLVSDAERAERAAEHAALNALVVKISGDGTSLIAYRDRAACMNGEPYALEDMTPRQRRAFERALAAHRGESHG